MDTWCPVGAVRGRVDHADPAQQRRIARGMGRGRAAAPCVGAGHRDAENARHGGDREVGLGRAHEPEDPPGPLSRANQGRRLCQDGALRAHAWFSRRSLAGSFRSGPVTPPSLQAPPTRSACRTQFQIDCAVGSNSRQSSSRVRPDPTELHHLPLELPRLGLPECRHLRHLPLKPRAAHKTGSTPECSCDRPGRSVRQRKAGKCAGVPCGRSRSGKGASHRSRSPRQPAPTPARAIVGSLQPTPHQSRRSHPKAAKGTQIDQRSTHLCQRSARARCRALRGRSRGGPTCGMRNCARRAS